MPLYSYSEDAPLSLSSVLLVEVNRNWSRQQISLAPPAADLPMGAVLALDDDGNYLPYLTDEGDNKAVAVLVSATAKNSAAVPGVAILRGAVVSGAGLSFIEGVSDAQKKAAFAQLNALGIVVQE